MNLSHATDVIRDNFPFEANGKRYSCYSLVLLEGALSANFAIQKMNAPALSHMESMPGESVSGQVMLAPNMETVDEARFRLFIEATLDILRSRDTNRDLEDIKKVFFPDVLVLKKATTKAAMTESLSAKSRMGGVSE